MRKHGDTPSQRDKHVMLAAISPPGVARGRFVGGHQSALAGCKPPPLFMRRASPCSSQGRREGEQWGASPRPSAPTYLPTSVVPPCASSSTRTAPTWNITPGPPSLGASSHGELGTLADAVTATPPPATIRPRNIWVVVDATVDIHLTRRLADKALESGLTTEAFGLWMAFRGMHPQDALHIVKQESHRYIYRNGRADTQAKHQSTSHTRGLEHVRLDTPHYSRLQHLCPIPSATQPPNGYPRTRRTQIETSSTTTPHPSSSWPPHWATQRTPNFSDASKTPSTHPSTTPPYARRASQHTYKNPDSNSPSNSFPSSPDTTDGTHAARSTSPQDTPNASVAMRTKRTWDDFKWCPLYQGLDTLEDWNPTHTIAQHAGWLTRSPVTQQLTTVLKQTEVLEAVRRGLIPTAVYTLLRTHAEDPQATAAHMQGTAVAKTPEQLTYRTHKYLQHAATLPQTDRAHLLKLLFYEP